MIYRVEIRVDVEADSPDAAATQARDEIANGGGEVTAVFDEDWEEV